jgi:hypothetical protein
MTVGMRRALKVTAGLSVTLHLVGLVAAALWLRPGTPAVSLQERLSYLATSSIVWCAGWGVWMLCALALVAFLAALARHTRSETASLAVIVAAVGAGVDLLCDSVQITVLPALAAAGPGVGPLFLAFERAAGAGGVVVANGLYSIAVLLAAVGLRNRIPAGLTLGAATFLCGMLMVAAGFSGDPRHLELATGLTLGASLAWTVVVTRALVAEDRP